MKWDALRKTMDTEISGSIWTIIITTTRATTTTTTAATATTTEFPVFSYKFSYLSPHFDS
jgi:hypothetical protein